MYRYMTKVDLVVYCRRDTLHAFDIKFLGSYMVLLSLPMRCFSTILSLHRDFAKKEKSCIFLQIYSSLREWTSTSFYKKMLHIAISIHPFNKRLFL